MRESPHQDRQTDIYTDTQTSIQPDKGHPDIETDIQTQTDRNPDGWTSRHLDR